jgi:glycosyltransferase involved in cell wall biosynthesis
LRILIAIGVPREREAGGAGVVLNHQQELVRLGHEVDCWFLDDVLVNRRPSRFEGLSFAATVAKRILGQRKSYDVVNIHAPSGCVYGIYRRLLRPRGAPPYVMTMQGSEERYSYVMRREDRKGRATNFNWKNRLWHRMYHQNMYDYSIKTADCGAVANREAWSLAALKFGREPGKFRYVPNGVEPRFFIERQYSPHPPGYLPAQVTTRLLYVGTWLDRKGVHYLADAFSSLAGTVPGISLTLAGCQGDESRVKSFFSPQARERVILTPKIKREDMPALYAAHDVFVFPSLMEGMPLTLLEAMATGMPVVVAETPGMVELVEGGFNGLLVQPADAPGLAAAVDRLCNSAELRARLGQAAQSTMRRYTWEFVTLKLERLLSLATQPKGRD